MNNINLHHIHPLLQKIIDRIVQSGVGEVIATDDGHLFVQTCNAIKAIHGALDLKKEGDAAGVRVVVRKVKKRAKNSKYAGMPMLQLYVLPITLCVPFKKTHNIRQTILTVPKIRYPVAA